MEGRPPARCRRQRLWNSGSPAPSSPARPPRAGKIVTWLKQPGDKVKKGESIVVVESDKADMDVESFSEGILGAIVIPEGGVATVGAAIAYIAESEADLADAKAKAGAPWRSRAGRWERARYRAACAARTAGAMLHWRASELCALCADRCGAAPGWQALVRR